MPAKVLITAPFPTLEETAREMGVPLKRAREIAELVDAIVERRRLGLPSIPAARPRGRKRAIPSAAGRAVSRRKAAARKRASRR